MRNLYVRLALPMVVISAVASAGLAATYAVTKGPIERTNRANEEKALRAVLPGADTFKAVAKVAEGDAGAIAPKLLAAINKASGETPVTAVYAAMKGTTQVGWGVRVTPRGYGGPMTLVVGLDSSGKVTAVSISGHNETPGLGTKAVGPDESSVGFLAGFTGATDPERAAKLDGITGATKSSRGVKRGVEAALLVFRDVLSKGGDQR